jgi:L-fuculose-phosphate aldolase
MSHIPNEVLAAAQEMYRKGLVEGTAGNVSARDPDGSVWLTPSSVPYMSMQTEQVVQVDLDGNKLGGEGSPTSELALHLECYRRYPEVKGVVHCHPAYASMFAVARKPIPPAIEEVVIYLGGDVPVCEYRQTGSDELGDAVADKLVDRSAALMANHGLVCIGKSADDALHSAAVSERTAQIVYGAATLGELGEVPPKVINDLQGVYVYLRGETW